MLEILSINNVLIGSSSLKKTLLLAKNPSNYHITIVFTHNGDKADYYPDLSYRKHFCVLTIITNMFLVVGTYKYIVHALTANTRCTR